MNICIYQVNTDRIKMLIELTMIINYFITNVYVKHWALTYFLQLFFFFKKIYHTVNIRV